MIPTTSSFSFWNNISMGLLTIWFSSLFSLQSAGGLQDRSQHQRLGRHSLPSCEQLGPRAVPQVHAGHPGGIRTVRPQQRVGQDAAKVQPALSGEPAETSFSRPDNVPRGSDIQAWPWLLLHKWVHYRNYLRHCDLTGNLIVTFV